MFGSTYPTFQARDIVSDRVRDPEFAAYLQWEYRPADRARVIVAASRRGTADRRRHRTPIGARVARHLRSWINAIRGTPNDEARVADAVRSFPLLTSIEELEREAR